MKPFYSFVVCMLALVMGCRQKAARETVQQEWAKWTDWTGGNWSLPDLVPVHVSQMVEGATFRPDLRRWNNWPVVQKVPAYYLIGDKIFREDELPFEANTDTSSWKNLGRGRFKDNRFIYFECPWSWYTVKEWPGKVSLAGYTAINDYLYKGGNGDLYVPGVAKSSTYEHTTLLEKVTPRPNLDFASLKHIAGHFFTDKNGLWFLGHSYNSKQSRLLQSCPAPGTEAQVFERYLVYGASVYSLSDPDDLIHLLELDEEKCREIICKGERWSYLLTDGNVHYDWHSHWEDTRKYDGRLTYWNSKELLAQLPHWQVINDEWIPLPLMEDGSGICLGSRNETNNYHFDEREIKIINTDNKCYNPFLIYTPAGFFMVEGAVLDMAWQHGMAEREVTQEECEGFFWQKIDHVWIHNYDRGLMEPLEPAWYELLDNGYYLYKGRLYKKNLPVAHHLRGEVCRLADTGYLTDGVNLFYMWSDDVYDAPQEWITDLFGNYMYKSLEPVNLVTYGVDMESLEILNNNILKDKDYIYYEGRILPVKDYIPLGGRQ